MKTENAPPFVVFALPRSMTAWLSRLLTYREWHCSHEELKNVRNLDDVKSWLSMPCTGTVETAAAPFWRLLKDYRPDARVAVVRRPVAEVVDSLMRIPLHGTGEFDWRVLTKAMTRMDAKLDQIERRWPGCVSIGFDEDDPDAYCELFEHCLPYPFDWAWFAKLRNQNVQCSMPHIMRYFTAYRPQLAKANAIARHAMMAALNSGAQFKPDGMTFQLETFEEWWKDGKALFEDHCVRVGEAPYGYLLKNVDLARAMYERGAVQIMTARSNGRMFGYLMTLMSPSLERSDLTVGVQTTFYASPDVPGLGLKLQRAALAEAKAMGLGEVFYRAGDRGDGPRMGTLYKRLGAEKDGDLFRLTL